MSMSGLGGLMRKQHPRTRAGIQATGQQRGYCADIAIHQHWNRTLGAGDIRARQRGDLQATKTAQQLEHTDVAIQMKAQRALHCGAFERQTVIVNAGAAPHGRLRWQIKQCAGQRRSGGGVADPHFTADEQVGCGGCMHCATLQRET